MKENHGARVPRLHCFHFPFPSVETKPTWNPSNEPKPPSPIESGKSNNGLKSIERQRRERMAMLTRNVLRSLLTSQKIRAPSPSIYTSFPSFSPLSSPAKSDAGTVSAGAAADVAEDDLLLDDDFPTSASSTATATATLPVLLQPRVVIYDGVCHLCHTGNMTILYICNCMF